MRKTFPRLGETKTHRKINIPGFGEAINGADFTSYLKPWPELIVMTFEPVC